MPQLDQRPRAQRPCALVSEHVAGHVLGGYPVVTADRFVTVEGDLVSGQLVEVRDESDRARGGWGVWDADEKMVRVLGVGECGALDLELVRSRVASAIELRRRLGLMGDGRALRLLAAEAEGLPGIVADLYGEYVVLHQASRALEGLTDLVIDALRESLTLQGIVVKDRARHSAGSKSERARIVGQSPPRRLEVREGQFVADVHLHGNVNTGLFTDLRLERERLMEIATDRRALSTFSYTGLLGAALGRGGASQVTFVDIAEGMHGWAARNLQLNDLDATDESRFRFVSVDVLEHMKELHVAGERFDLVLLDPPTYSAARPSAWSLKRQLPILVERAIGLLSGPQARIWLAVTSRAHREDVLVSMVQRGAAAAGSSIEVLARRGLPPEHPTLACYPRGSYLKVLELAAS